MVREAKDITIKRLQKTYLILHGMKKKESTKKDKEFFGKKIVNLLKKCYNKCKNLITKIRKITDKMETVGDILEDRRYYQCNKENQRIWNKCSKAVASTETKCTDNIWFRRPILHRESLRMGSGTDSNLRRSHRYYTRL